ncbi:serine hydroxymethyltransferase [Spiroplasma endosymbiont of Anurida maritima]|uniref:serine hydroxymethyltransferase n=1 Tax=Spiroplasma endosymbiont of Anurida maritima TaxID=2967972 RepID=UPI0036D3F95A
MNKIIKENIKLEKIRQNKHIELIASENYTSKSVRKITGSILTNKYAEGYPGRRYYGGCEFIDKIEQLAIDKAKELFNAEYANVQPHSGTQANTAVYLAVLKPKDKVVGMSLNSGGHLTHGSKVNISGILYDFAGYDVDPKTQELDYEQVEELCLKEKPKLIIAGASAYSLKIDFKRFREIADKCGAYLMVDMAHIAGLVAAGLHQNPCEFADFVTTTTHKTLRGPRGGLILAKKEHAKMINSAVFPGTQGGPLEHIIAAKAQCFIEALEPEFKTYQQQVVDNAKAFCDEFTKLGVKVIANDTENHQFSVNVKSSYGITGKDAEDLLTEINIICNKNMIPFDDEKPAKCSGIRLGTPAMTTRGMNENHFIKLANIMNETLKNHTDKNIILNNRKAVDKLIKKLKTIK